MVIFFSGGRKFCSWVYLLSGVIAAMFSAVFGVAGCNNNPAGKPASVYALTVDIAPSLNVGEVLRSPDDSSYAAGTEVTLTAVPVRGYVFVGWSGGLTSPDSVVTVIMNNNLKLTAMFTPGLLPPDTLICLLVTGALPGDAGTVSVSPGSGIPQNGSIIEEYVFNTEVTLMAAPANGYVFAGWSGSFMDQDSIVTFKMNGHYLMIANFVPDYTINPDTTDNGRDTVDTYTLTTAVGQGLGYVSRLPDYPLYPSGMEVFVSASAAGGYVFAGWSGASTSKDNLIKVVMDGDKSLTADFLPLYTLAINMTPADGGMVSAPDVASYAAGTKVDVRAEARDGYIFAGWFDGGEKISTDAGITVTVDRNITLTASFQREYIITTDIIPAGGGTVLRNPNLERYTDGTRVTLTAQAAEGYMFTGWMNDAMEITSANPIMMVTVNSSRTLIAVFSLEQRYPLLTSVIPQSCGTVSRTPDEESYAAGTRVTLTAEPSGGCVFSRWVDHNGETVSTEPITTITITGNAMVMIAEFDVNVYTLTTSVIPLSLENCGTVIRSPNQDRYNEGTQITLTAAAGDGCVFVRWRNQNGEEISTENIVTVTMTCDKALIAEFAENAID
ncbi:MAG: InlB B-repeat-containing protein [Chitinispirillales bacterium]|nr:InlB B-repeat-containing protein [Chitinispirillales bacterium]